MNDLPADSSSTPRAPQFQFQVPDDLAAGVYSNLVGVWHTAYEFTLDFSVMLPGEVTTNSDGEQVRVVPARVVSRVKIPPSTVFALMRALSENEALYVQNVGPITTPGSTDTQPPLHPPH